MITDVNRLHKIIFENRDIYISYIKRKLQEFPVYYLKKYPYILKSNNNAQKVQKMGQVKSTEKGQLNYSVTIPGWFTEYDFDLLFDDTLLSFLNSPTSKRGFNDAQHAKRYFFMSLKNHIRISFHVRIKKIIKVPLSNKEFETNFELARSIIDKTRPVKAKE